MVTYTYPLDYLWDSFITNYDPYGLQNYKKFPYACFTINPQW